uniref:Putative ribonuclease H-like domain-containing protein n=1 Tax=Tanacetum cinerariifolium TaxID=118510 RepID=A0A6L2MRE1_TANCI|nr:putative ribonuclease H-like domain-containing protein [Tanacetum cinerariifolium]
MDKDSAYMVAASKVPMLKPDEYELWRMRIQMVNYSLWDVIENGNAPPITQVVKEEFVNESKVSEPTVKKPIVETSEAKASTDKPKVERKNFSPPLIEDWISNGEDEAESKPKIEKKIIKPSFAKIAFVKSKKQVKSPRKTIVKQIIKKLIEDMLPLEVTLKEGKSQAENSVLFNDTECTVLSPNFKLTDESQVLLRVLRKNNMCSVDLKNIVPKGLTCLFAKAACDESKLWHRRLVHLNFKTVNNLVKGNLVRARTSQQNRVAEKRNRTNIKAIRTMLADSKLPTTFWAEAVNTACYVQNRVLAVKPYNKTPYELFHGRTPALSFMRPFGCPLIILNTKDHLGNQSNDNVGTKVCDDASKARMETIPDKDYILLPLWTADPLISQESKSSQNDGFQPSRDNGKKVDEDTRQENECKDQDKQDNVNITNNVNVVGTNKVNVVGANTSNELPFDPEMPALEDINTFNFLSDYKDDDEETDMNNMDTTIQEHRFVTTINQRTSHKDLQNYLFACFSSQKEPKMVIHALKDPNWIEAMQEDLLQFKLQEVWNLVDLPYGKRAIGTKWVFRNKKDERGLQVKQKKNGIFISQDKYVAEILKKYGFSEVKNASTPILKDVYGEEVDCKKQNVVANSTTEVEYVAASSCCGQATVKAKTLNGERQLQALVDGKKVIITESTIRRDLQLEDVEMDDSLERAATTATSLDADQDRGNISKTQSKATPNEPGSQGTILGGGLRCQEATGDTAAQTKVLDLETTNTTQAMEIESLKRRVKKLERINRSKTYGLKRLYKVRLSTRVESFEDEEVSDVDEVNAVSTATTTTATIDDITLAKALVEIKSAKPKTTTASSRPKLKGLLYIIKSKHLHYQFLHNNHHRLQAEEQDELIDTEKAKLFMEFSEKRRKFSAAKRAEEKRNKSPTFKQAIIS